MKILIIHTAFIGDIVLSTPILAKIKDWYSSSEISYVTTPQGAELLKNNPHISKVIQYDKKAKNRGVKEFFKLGKNLKQEKYDMVFSLHRYMRSSFLAWLTGAKVRKGYDISSGSFFFTEKIVYKEKKHEVERILSFLKKSKLKKDLEYRLELYPGREEIEKVDALLKGVEGKKIVAIAPGSKWFTKKWPLDYFNKIILALSKREDIVQVIIGGREEQLLNVHLKKNCIDLRAKTSLLELAEVLKRSDVVLTNDSSPIHIASAFKKPFIVALFGPTVEKFGFFPWSKNSYVFENHSLKCRPCAIHGGDKCPKGHFKCMLDIRPDEVIKKIKELI